MADAWVHGELHGLIVRLEPCKPSGPRRRGGLLDTALTIGRMVTDGVSGRRAPRRAVPQLPHIAAGQQFSGSGAPSAAVVAQLFSAGTS